jgi:hypothetical protein
MGQQFGTQTANLRADVRKPRFRTCAAEPADVSEGPIASRLNNKEADQTNCSRRDRNWEGAAGVGVRSFSDSVEEVGWRRLADPKAAEVDVESLLDDRFVKRRIRKGSSTAPMVDRPLAAQSEIVSLPDLHAGAQKVISQGGRYARTHCNMRDRTVAELRPVDGASGENDPGASSE